MKSAVSPNEFKLGSRLLSFLGLLWFLSIISADFRDPTFFNPLYPVEGLHNWLSLPGALLGGSLIELLGPIALLIPWIVFRILLCLPEKVSRWILFYHACIVVIVSSAALAFFDLTSGSSQPLTTFLRNPGYLGLIASKWLSSFMGRSLGLLFCFILLVYGFSQLYKILSPIDLLKTLFHQSKNLIHAMVQRKGAGKRILIKESLTKKRPIIYQTRIQTKDKINHPL